MTSPNPKVTVLISTYNRPDYLKEAIRSVVDQTMTGWELLVINDGGVDVGSMAESFNDPRIKYFHREKNRGKAACCNFGLEQARGEYI
ncbi:MAG: glycosyltransferase family 2 protein, partial [Thermodesulfobacteriota bacterium]|nr:glycosyltransferase family 2 protein [Thermodesulfobacteriota bacterium]